MRHIGVDLHKTKFVACFIGADDTQSIETYPLTRAGLARFRRQLRKTDELAVEATQNVHYFYDQVQAQVRRVRVVDTYRFGVVAKSKKKTDKADARARARFLKLGWLPEVPVPSEQVRCLRQLLQARETLVQTRTKYISVVRSMLRREGVRVPGCAAGHFRRHVEAMSLPEHLRAATGPLLEVLRVLDEQISQADEKLGEVAKSAPLIKRLCLIPSVGPVISITFVALVGACSRFASAKQVRAYLGLVPKEDGSGERQLRGHITKAGSSRMRSLLVEVGWSILSSKKAEVQGLRRWALAVAARRGKRVAVVALARKLAGILYAMWRDGTQFDPGRMQVGNAAATGSWSTAGVFQQFRQA